MCNVTFALMLHSVYSLEDGVERCCSRVELVELDVSVTATFCRLLTLVRPPVHHTLVSLALVAFSATENYEKNRPM